MQFYYGIFHNFGISKECLCYTKQAYKRIKKLKIKNERLPYTHID